MNVLDASVAIKWVLPEQDSEKALVIRDEFQKQIRELIAPDVFPVEVAHALTRAERKGLITQDDVDAKMADIYLSAPILHDYIPLLERAIEMAKQFRIGVYDCLYLALAEQEQCAFITADAKLKALSLPYVMLLSNLQAE